MCDHDSDQARKKRHSTTTQALRYKNGHYFYLILIEIIVFFFRVAKAVDCYRMILTHFSQRQSDIPVYDFVKEDLKPIVEKLVEKEHEKKLQNKDKNSKHNSPLQEHGHQKEKVFSDDEEGDDDETKLNSNNNNSNIIPTDVERLKIRGDPTSIVDERWKTGESLDLSQVMVAFDLMRVNIVDLPKLPHMLPILKYLYVYFKLYEIERVK